MRSRPFIVGDIWTFKRQSGQDLERRGKTATITGIGESVDRPHPGFVHHLHIDLVTETGIHLQWPPSTLRSEAR